MSHLAIELITGSVLCLLHLVVGMAVGTRIGRTNALCVGVDRPFLSALPRAERTEIQRLQSLWIDLRLRLSELTSCARQLQQLPREVVFGWRNELVQLADELFNARQRNLGGCDAAAMTNEAHSINAPALEQCVVQEVIPANEIITNAQILELLDPQKPGFESRDESCPLVRYRFSVKQPLAPAVNSSPLAAEAFRMVQFHDLSIRDVRYFVDEKPTEDKVVIGLGVPKPVIWIAGEVQEFRSVFMYGRVGYLVTARLLASIDKRNQSAPLVEYAEGG